MEIEPSRTFFALLFAEKGGKGMSQVQFAPHCKGRIYTLPFGRYGFLYGYYLP